MKILAKSDFCDLYTFETRGCECHFIFMKGVPTSKTLGTYAPGHRFSKCSVWSLRAPQAICFCFYF